jgi:hypothetical protein
VDEGFTSSIAPICKLRWLDATGPFGAFGGGFSVRFEIVSRRRWKPPPMENKAAKRRIGRRAGARSQQRERGGGGFIKIDPPPGQRSSMTLINFDMSAPPEYGMTGIDAVRADLRGRNVRLRGADPGITAEDSNIEIDDLDIG